MDLGFTFMNAPSDPHPGVLGKELEDRGFESLWCGEHTHIPVSRDTPYPAGGPLPDLYLRQSDPFVGLMAAASTTTTLKIGTSVALVLQNDPFRLAKSVATVDRLSGGRFLFGVGCGWNVEEMANHTDLPWAQRYNAMADMIAALKALWTEDEAEHHGPFYDFDPVYSYPKPMQQPHPPIVLGTAGKLGTKHAVAWADGWMPIDSGVADMGRKLQRFREAAEAAGRDPASIEISMMGFGDPDIAALEHYREIGVQRLILGASRANWDDPSTILPFLDRYADLIPKVR